MHLCIHSSFRELATSFNDLFLCPTSTAPGVTAGQGVLPSLLEPTAWLGPRQGTWDQTDRANGRFQACGSGLLHETLPGAPKSSFRGIPVPEGSAASPKSWVCHVEPSLPGTWAGCGAARLPGDLFPGLSPSSLTLTLVVVGGRYSPDGRASPTSRLAREGSAQPRRLRTPAAWKAPHVQASRSRLRRFPAMNWASESEPPARLRLSAGPAGGGGCAPKSRRLARTRARSCRCAG